MRVPAALAAVVLAAVACHDGITCPLSGLRTTLSFPALSSGVPAAPSIAGAGDSVVAIVELGFPPCEAYRADAGIRLGTLVMTISDSLTNPYCTIDLGSGPPFARLVVHDVPRGAYRAIIDLRSVPGTRGAQTRTVMKSKVSLP